MAFRSSAVEVIVPATSANLGPGFDAFGLALGVRDHLTAMVTDDPGVLVDVQGEGHDALPRDERHLVVKAFARGCDAMGLPLPGLVIRCDNAIPQGRGLGSSAAAIVAGLLLARALVTDGLERLSDADILGIATSMEGHPDNVAAALLGGFTTAWLDGDDAAQAVTRSVLPDVVPVVSIPPMPMSTSAARRMLGESVSRSDAVFNIGRAALLVHALTTDPTLLFAATEDRLHQDARASAYPESHALVVRLRERGLPAAISGAGPTVIALVSSDDVAAVTAEVSAPWTSLVLPVDHDGARVHVHGS